MEETKNTDVKEVVIGEFKPKRQFLNFVSAVNGARIRFIRDVAFLKGERLSGVLEGIIFKVTICDEGTIKFEEIDTNRSNKEQIQRLIDDIDSMDVSGYAQKFIVSGLPFDDVDGKLCYLEVENQKPIDKLKSIFDDKPTLSDKSASLLDDLFGSSDEVDSQDFIEETSEITSQDCEENSDSQKIVTKSYMDEAFAKMNEDKVVELKKRISDNESEVKNLKREISISESKLEKVTKDLGVLQSRLDSFNSNDEPNGYVFYVSEEKKSEVGLTEDNRVIADKIADIIGLKKDVLFKMLTEGHYQIRIAEKSDIKSESVKMTSELIEKIDSLTTSDKDSKITQVESGHFEYRGSLTWHQIVKKMIRSGFEQSPEFDQHCESNSYTSHESENKIEDVKKNKKKKK